MNQHCTGRLAWSDAAIEIGGGDRRRDRARGTISMRVQAILAFVSLLGFTSSALPAEPVGAVSLHYGEPSKPPKAAAASLGALGVELLKSSNFNSATHPKVLKQSVPMVHDRYRRVVAGDCLVITYDHAVKVRTLGGEVSVFEIVIELGHPDFADALFTVDDRGGVVAHEKYSGGVVLELRRAVEAAAGDR